MAPRVSKSDEKVMDEFGFAFAEPPAVDLSRRSKYDVMWENAKELCKKFPGRTLQVRTHNNQSQAYDDAKKVNNGDKKVFKTDFAEWRAVAAPSANEEDVYEDGHPKAGERLTAVYLTYIGPAEDAE